MGAGNDTLLYIILVRSPWLEISAILPKPAIRHLCRIDEYKDELVREVINKKKNESMDFVQTFSDPPLPPKV